MSHILITFLGKGDKDGDFFYPTERYHFDGDDTDYYETNFFGLAVLKHLAKERHRADKLVVLGTNGSMWDAFYQLPDRLDSNYEDDYFALADIIENNAEYEEQQYVQPYLETTKTVLQEYLDNAVDCELRVIPYGETQDEQIAILIEMADVIKTGDTVSLDITYGLRHLPMLAVLSAMYLEVVRNVTIEDIYYGATEMKHLHNDVAPAVNLKGLLQIADWVTALRTFNNDGDYSVFANLLKYDGFSHAEDLKKAAYFERIIDLKKASQRLDKINESIEKDGLPGIGGLFVPQLQQRISWYQSDSPDDLRQLLYAQQCQLAWSSFDKRDYWRAVNFAIEAIITRSLNDGEDPYNFSDRSREQGHVVQSLNGENKRSYVLLKEIYKQLIHGIYDREIAYNDPFKVQKSIISQEAKRLLQNEGFLRPKLMELMDNLLKPSFLGKYNKKDDYTTFDEGSKSAKSVTTIERETETQFKSELEQAAERGDSQAQFRLGEEFYRQKDKPYKLNKAIEWWKKAAEQKHTEALYYLGEVYYFPKPDLSEQEDLSELEDNKGESEHLNFEEAIHYWHEAAKLGHQKAQYRLANAYYQGKGTELNQKEALKWWQKSAVQGHITAQYNLGIAYLKGLGTAENDEKAKQSFQKVAEHSDDNNSLVISARYQLGILYKKSHEYQQAKDWLRRSAGYGNEIDGLLEEYGKNWLKIVVDEKDIKEEELITLVRQSAQQLLEDIVKLDEQEKAKKEVEDIMAMFAHKFRGPLQSIQYNAEHNNHQKVTLQAVQTMAGLLDIFSIVATEPETLRKRLQQESAGDGTLVGVLEKVLLPVIEQVLTLANTKKILQHYLRYAKKTKQVPLTTTRKQLVEDYELEEPLQTNWENSFSALLGEPSLEKLSGWLEEHFFRLEISGFNDDSIHFEHYGATESTLFIVLNEILLNAIKYYSSETNEPVKLSWQHDQDFCRLICENPTHRTEQRVDKGTYKGHKFLSTIARNLQGNFFPKQLPNNYYRVEIQIPTHLFVTEVL